MKLPSFCPGEWYTNTELKLKSPEAIPPCSTVKGYVFDLEFRSIIFFEDKNVGDSHF